MAESPYVKEILEELEKNARLVRDEELHKAAREVLGARRVFAAGSGRSGQEKEKLSAFSSFSSSQSETGRKTVSSS